MDLVAPGVIVVLNRAALEANTCECYDAVNLEYRRLLDGRKHTENLAPQRCLRCGRKCRFSHVARTAMCGRG
jgi:hypothetical protein